MSTSVSGLSADHRRHARYRTLQAAQLGLRHAEAIHYTQGAKRWSGINNHEVASHGEYAAYYDCSSFATWCLWNGLFVPYGVRDVVNGEGWRAGYTGTMLDHGKRVVHEYNIKIGDLALYGSGPPGEHVAICIGGGKVISHGSEGGPYLLPLHYRSDLYQIRRYI